MCVVSMVGDHYRDKWTDPYRWPHYPVVPTPFPPVVPGPPVKAPLSNEEVIRRAIELTKRAQEAQQKEDSGEKTTKNDAVSRAEFNELRLQVLEMREWLIRAKKYDQDNNEPHCEMEDKVELLKRMAELMGVGLGDVFEDGR